MGSSDEYAAVGAGTDVRTSGAASVTNDVGATVGDTGDEPLLFEPSPDRNNFGSGRLDPFLRAMARPVASGTTSMPTANSKQHIFRKLKTFPLFLMESSIGAASTIR